MVWNSMKSRTTRREKKCHIPYPWCDYRRHTPSGSSSILFSSNPPHPSIPSPSERGGDTRNSLSSRRGSGWGILPLHPIPCTPSRYETVCTGLLPHTIWARALCPSSTREVDHSRWSSIYRSECADTVRKIYISRIHKTWVYSLDKAYYPLIFSHMSQKSLINWSAGYMIAGLIIGLVYRELTRDYTGETILGAVHGHIFTLGMMWMLILALLDKSYGIIGQKYWRSGFMVYTAGLHLTLIMMIIRGITEVKMTTLTSAQDHMIAGFAGIGHITLSIGLIMIFIVLRRVIR